MALSKAQIERLGARTEPHPVLPCQRCYKRPAFGQFKVRRRGYQRDRIMDLCAACGFEIGGDRVQVMLCDPETKEPIRDAKGNEVITYPQKYSQVKLSRSYVHGLKVDTSMPPEPPKPKRQRVHKSWTPSAEWLANVKVKGD